MKSLVLLCLSIRLLSASVPSTNVRKKNDPQKMSSEKRLVNDLIDRYSRIGRQGRPVLDDTKAVPVKFGLGLIQMDLDEKLNVLTMSMWARLHWKDDYLTWDPGKYDNVSSFRLSQDQLWIPDIMLYNTASVDNPVRDALAVVFHDGSVHWFPHTIYKSTCKLNIANFPFDEQLCHMWFGSWTHPATSLNLSMAFPGGIDLSTFRSDHKEGSAWEVYNVTGSREMMGDSPPFIVLQFKVFLRRRMVFSTYMLTLPCVFLACLTMVVFWLPPERPDRIGLAMALFSSFMLLLLILVEAAPPTASSVPKLGIYYCFNLVLILVSILLSTLVVNISRGQTGNKAVSRCIYLPCLKLSKILLCQPYPKRHHVGAIKGGSFLRDISSVEEESPVHANDRTNHRQLFEMTSVALRSSDVLQNIQLEMAEMRHLLCKMENSTLSPERAEERTELQEEWRLVGMVLDRIFFLIYIMLVVANLAAFFPRPDHKFFSPLRQAVFT